MTITDVRDTTQPILDENAPPLSLDTIFASYASQAPQPAPELPVGPSTTRLRSHNRRKQPTLPNRIGLAALLLALGGAALAVLLVIGMVEWFTPIFLIAPAVATAISALSLPHHRKAAAVAALVVCGLATVPPTAAFASTIATAGTGITAGEDATAVNPLDAFLSFVTQSPGDDTGTDDGGTGTDDDGTDDTDTDGTGPDNDSDDIIDVNLGGDGDLVDVVDVPEVIEKTTGFLGDVLTTASGVSMSVASAQCGLNLPLLSGLTGQLCAVDVDVTNGSDHAVSVSSSSMTGISGSSTFLGNGALGLNPLSATVQPGASSSGRLYFRMPSSSTLDALQFRFGGEPASSTMTVNVN